MTVYATVEINVTYIIRKRFAVKRYNPIIHL